MTVSALSAAKYACAYSGWSLSNLELQKILYIAHMYHMGKFRNPLLDGNFEAWDYGPVHPTIYHRAKVYGAAPVGNVFHSVEELDGNSTEGSVIRGTVDRFRNYEPGQLVAITHSKISGWYNNYRPGARGMAIPNQDIMNEFEERQRRAGEHRATT